MQVELCQFYEHGDIFKSVKKQIDKVRHRGELIDYLTFVPDGEPTLDVNLGYEDNAFAFTGNA